jgi:hypothetical protein
VSVAPIDSLDDRWEVGAAQPHVVQLAIGAEIELPQVPGRLPPRWSKDIPFMLQCSIKGPREAAAADQFTLSDEDVQPTSAGVWSYSGGRPDFSPW